MMKKNIKEPIIENEADRKLFMMQSAFIKNCLRSGLSVELTASMARLTTVEVTRIAQKF